MIDDRVISSHELKKELANLPEQRFFPTGMKWLDELTGKFAEGDFVVIGGSQKAGKSLLAITLTRNFIEQKINCLWFEIELSYREFLERFGEELPVFYLPKVLNVPTLTWIEQKIDEAIKKYDVKIVFIDDLGMVTDENLYKQNNAVDILDSRLLAIKRMAVRKNICIVGINPFVSASLRKKKTEMDTSDFRGTARIGYTADLLLGIERNIGTSKVRIAQETEPEEFFISTDTFIFVLDCRRTGSRKIKIKCHLDEKGFIKED
jgi:hypothetical protein